MVKKQTYEELELRIKELERESAKREQVEETLRESEEKYRTLFEEALNPILVVDETGRYVGVNMAALEFLECDRDELLGKNVWDFTPPDLLKRQRQEHAPFVSRRTLETEYLVHGAIKTLLLNVVPLEVQGKTVLYGIGQDITERKKTEEALRKSEEKYKLLAEHTADVIYKVRLEDEEYTYVSPSVERLLGYTSKEVLSLRVMDVLTAESYEAQRKRMQEDLASGRRDPVILELEAVHKDRHTFPVEIHTSFLLGDQENPVEILGVARDVTERKQVEDNLRKVNRELKNANEKLTAAYGWIRESRDRLRKHQWKEDIGFIVGREGKIDGVTERALECTGRSRAELVGHPIMDFIDESCHEEFKSELRQAWIGIARNFPVILKHSYESKEIFQATLTRLTLESRRSLLVILR